MDAQTSSSIPVTALKLKKKRDISIRQGDEEGCYNNWDWFKLLIKYSSRENADMNSFILLNLTFFYTVDVTVFKHFSFRRTLMTIDLVLKLLKTKNCHYEINV